MGSGTAHTAEQRWLEMISDSKRREVAAKLRDDAKGGALPYSDFFGAVAYDVGVEKEHAAVLNRLADLIEPSCDRDALLALEEEMEGEKRDISCSTCRDDFGLACYDYKPNAACMEACLRYYARRIRWALGVDDA